MAITVERAIEPTPELIDLIDELDRTLGANYEAYQRHGISPAQIFEPHVHFFWGSSWWRRDELRWCRPFLTTMPRSSASTRDRRRAVEDWHERSCVRSRMKLAPRRHGCCGWRPAHTSARSLVSMRAWASQRAVWPLRRDARSQDRDEPVLREDTPEPLTEADDHS
jgi:hypothetical protein